MSVKKHFIAEKTCLNVIALWHRMTAHVEVHPHQAAATATSPGQTRPASSSSKSAARYNYGYVGDDDREDAVPYRDWQQTRPAFTSRTLPGNELEDIMPLPLQNPATADPYRRPAANASKPLSVISRNLSSSAQSGYSRPGVGVYPADVNLSQTDIDV